MSGLKEVRLKAKVPSDLDFDEIAETLADVGTVLLANRKRRFLSVAALPPAERVKLSRLGVRFVTDHVYDLDVPPEIVTEPVSRPTAVKGSSEASKEAGAELDVCGKSIPSDD